MSDDRYTAQERRFGLPDYERAEAAEAALDETRAALVEANATIARVREVCAAARDAGNALVFCISVESALDGGA